MTDNPHLKLIDDANKKEIAYKKRATSQKVFYSQARINSIAIDRLKEALRSSVVIDENSKVVFKWSDEMIEALIADIEDPGPVRKG